jgi:hypothetical protein
MGNFKAFKNVVVAQFAVMQKHQLYRVNVNKDELWEKYLASFPEGTNEIYRERREHDCSCCKSFVRNVGDVVVIMNGKVVSLWDVTVGEPPYQKVADALAGIIRHRLIKDRFLHFERMAGTDRNFEQTTEGVKTWEHFFVNIDARFVKKGSDIAAALAEPRESKNVLLRSLTEIDDDAVSAVAELISQGSLYRGDEHKFAVETFQILKREFAQLKTDTQRDFFAWEKSGAVGAVARMRNTVIGTLLVDLSSGVDLEVAVKAFESKVAPTNYKRPTALVTKAMVDAARKTVEELGMTSALRRRHATIHDVTINNIVFANRNAKKPEGDIFDEVATAGSKIRSLDRVDEVGIEKFLTDILPYATSLEIMVENRHASNFVSLIAPEDPTSESLFKWGNRFSWSYNGEMADSIRERVKAAGGSVTGDLCCRLAWEYTDDLDFHMHEPGRYHISFQNRRQLSPNGGMLDLDANGADGMRSDPAENIFYADRNRMTEGDYQLSVNNYSRRSDGRGFVVEIEFDGQVHRIEYDKVLGTSKTTLVAKIRYSKKTGFEIVESLPSSQTSREVWGIKTQTFNPVNALMLSPNHWDGGVTGNKHYFFMIDGARNDGSARGFFNEFLREALSKHRKVLEMVGGKMKVEGSDQQLSGLGFSSTMKNSVVCRVKGNFTRVIKVTF